MTTGLTRRRRTAQQILLRRACLSKSVSRSRDVAQIPAGLDRERGGIVVLPSLARDPDLTRERSSTRAVRKLQRVLAASTYRVSGDRKSAGKLPGCEVLTKDTRSWRKLKQSEDNPNRSGHSLKPKERSGGSARSRNSSSIYPSSWPLAVKEEAKRVDSQGSLDEIINCSCLSRTPYDHKLSTPLKSDNSCQCSFIRKARRRNRKIKAVSVAQTQTQSIQNTRSISGNHLSEDKTNRRRRSSKDRLRNRVYSGEDVSPVRKSSKSNSENSKPSSKCKVNNPGVKFKNYGGYTPSETDIESTSSYKPKTPSRCSDSLFNKIEKVSRPPSLNGNKWSLKMPSNTEMQEYFNAADRENTCLKICLSNYNSTESQARRSRTSHTSNDQCTGKGSSNSMRRGSDRNSRMSDSFQGSQCCKCSSKANKQGYSTEEDGMEEFGSCRRSREASISSRTREASISSRNSEQFLSNYEDEMDYNNNNESSCIYQSNIIKNGPDPARIYQTNSYEFSTGADPSYERMLPRNENYPNRRLSNELNYGNTQPNQKLQHGGCGAGMGQSQRRTNSGLGIAGTHRDSTHNCPRSRASGPADRMGGSRGSCRTGNSGRGTTRGPSEMAKEWQPRDAIAHRKCTEAVTQTSEFLMAPRTHLLNAGNCSHKSDRGPLEANRYSQMQPNNRSRKPHAYEGKSCGLDINSQLKPFENQVQSRSEPPSKPKPLQLVQTNSLVFQSDQKQYNLVQINSVELNRSNQEAENTPYGSAFSRPPCDQEQANGNPESQKSSRNRHRNCSRNRRRNRTTCEEFNTFQGNQSHDNCICQGSDSSDQRQDKCDVIKILDILQKTVAGLEKEINKAKGYESGRSTRSGRDPKMNKRTVQKVDSKENCGQNRISPREPRSRPPYRSEYSDSYPQHNFSKPVCPNLNQSSNQCKGMVPERSKNIFQSSNSYKNRNCGDNNGVNPNHVRSPSDIYQDRNATPPVHNACNGSSPGNVEIPYRSAPDPGQAGGYATTEQDYPRDIYERKAQSYPYIEQTNVVSFQNNRMIYDPQEQNSFQSTNLHGNNPQSNACTGMTDPRYGSYLNDATQFGNQATKPTEYAACQSMYNADDAPPINRGGVNFQEYDNYSTERFDRNYKETEEYPILNRAESYQCQSNDALPINRGEVTFQEYNEYSNERFERNYNESEDYPSLNKAGSYQSQNGFKCCNPEPFYGEREAYPFIRSTKPIGECPHSSRNGIYSKDSANISTKPLSKGPQNTDRSRKQTCSKDPGAQKYKQSHQRRRSSSPKRVASPKRQASPKANKINKNRIQPKKVDNVPKTRKASDSESCGNPDRVNKASKKAQRPVKVTIVPNKSNVSKKQAPDKIRKDNIVQAYKVFDCAFCENPNCPNKKTVEKKNLSVKNDRKPMDHNYNDKKYRTSNQNTIRKNADCPDKVSRNVELRNENKQRRAELCENPERKMILCENPNCPDKKNQSLKKDNALKHIEHRYEKVSSCELCENPNCPDRKTNKPNQEDIFNKNATDSSIEDGPGRTRVLFADIGSCRDVNNKISRQGSGKSERFDDDPIETRICRQKEYHRYEAYEKNQVGRSINCRPCEIETRRKPTVGKCNLCLRPEIPPPNCVRNRHNPYIKTDPSLNSYDRHILKNFEKYKMEKCKSQKCAKVSSYKCTSKNQASRSDSSCSSSEETVAESSEEDARKRLCSCQSEESYKHEERDSKSKSSIFSCCKKPPREETDRNQKVTRPQKETKIQEKPESKKKEKSPPKSGGFPCCRNRDTPRSQQENPQKEQKKPKQEKPKQSEKTPSKKTPSKSSGFPCWNRERPRSQQENPPKEQEKPKQEKPKQSEKTSSKKSPSKSSGFPCWNRERPRSQQENSQKEQEKPKQEKPKQSEKTPSKSSGFLCFKKNEKSPPQKKEKNYSNTSIKSEKESPKPKRETEEKPSWFSGFQCRERSPKESKEKEIPQREEKLKTEKEIPQKEEKLKKEKEIPQREEKIKKEEKTKKPSKCAEFFSCSRKPKTQKERVDEPRPHTRIVSTNRQKEQVRPVDKCPCAEDQPRKNYPGAPPSTCPRAQEEQDNEEVKVLYDSSFRFSPESCSCAEIPKIVYCHNNPQEPGQRETASSSTFCRQGFEDPEDEYRPCASANGFYKILQ